MEILTKLLGIGSQATEQTATANQSQKPIQATTQHQQIDPAQAEAQRVNNAHQLQAPAPTPAPAIVQASPAPAHGPVLEQVGKLLSTIFPQDTVTQIMNFIAKFLPAPAIVQTPVQAPTQAAPVAQATQATNPQTSAEEQAMMTQLMQMLTTPETVTPQVPAAPVANNTTITPQATPTGTDPLAGLMQLLNPAAQPTPAPATAA